MSSIENGTILCANVYAQPSAYLDQIWVAFRSAVCDAIATQLGSERNGSDACAYFWRHF